LASGSYIFGGIYAMYSITPADFNFGIWTEADLSYSKKVFKIINDRNSTSCLKAEINEHPVIPNTILRENSGNSRIGFNKKTLKINLWEVPLDVPSDRSAIFDTIVVPKHQGLSSKIEQAIMTMYSRYSP
jgi:hypothetical protein